MEPEKKSLNKDTRSASFEAERFRKKTKTTNSLDFVLVFSVYFCYYYKPQMF